MQTITEFAQNGDFDPSQFGITTAQIITPKYLIKQSVNAGMTSAALNTVLSIGPDIFSILVQAAKEGEFDEAKLKSTGMEGLLAASEGFVEGSVSCAIVTACQAGKLGSALTNVSPEVVGMLIEFVIDDNCSYLNNQIHFYHHGKIAIGNIGCGKLDELREFVKKEYPKIISGKKYYLGSLTNDRLWRMDDKEVVKFIENLISYALIRDEYRDYKKALKEKSN